ncbi:MAG: 6-bladed beta-propeller [Candidatus Rokubacteria bacterium]|nr:6-bladed beta-propeller [Candidatus Rokubacteria bacterium]
MRRRSLAVALVIAALASGCGVAGAPRVPADTATPAALEWPRPPGRARIQFVKAVARPADLGVRPSFWERLGNVILGRQEEWLIRPTAVVAREGVLYVADPGAQALWMLDGQRGRFSKILKAKSLPLVSPVGVAAGPDGRIYLADSFLARIFVYDADLTSVATIEDPALRRPAGVAFDASRNRLYVADSATHQILVYTGDGRRVGLIGRRGAGDGEFNFPTYLAVDRAGTLYVTDSLGFRIQAFGAEGRFVSGFGRHGDSSGDFARPKGVALDSEGHVYVVEALFDAVQIFDRHGRFLLSFGERGLHPGQFWLPAGVFIDGQDRIYVADAYNQRIQIFQYLAGGEDE